MRRPDRRRKIAVYLIAYLIRLFRSPARPAAGEINYLIPFTEFPYPVAAHAELPHVVRIFPQGWDVISASLSPFLEVPPGIRIRGDWSFFPLACGTDQTL